MAANTGPRLAHLLISVIMPVTRGGVLRAARRSSCGKRPVVASFGSGSATSIPVISRSSETALMATRASWSAVAAPAETPSKVAVVRIVAGTCGFRPLMTTTTTASVTSGGTSTSSSATMSRRCARPFRRCGRRGAGGSQRGRDRRILLRADDQGGGDPLGGGKDRQLGTESEGSGVGGQRQDGE